MENLQNANKEADPSVKTHQKRLIFLPIYSTVTYLPHKVCEIFQLITRKDGINGKEKNTK